MYNINEDGIGIDGAKLATSDAVYRPAFPAYRVFIYYHEVTADVLEVRTNSTGGSMERTAGSASITLSNQYSKYLIDTLDIMKIGAAQATMNNRSNEVPFTKAELIQDEYLQLWDELTTLTAANNIDALKVYIEQAGLNIESFITTTTTGIEIINRETLIASVMEKSHEIIRDLSSYTVGFETVKNDVVNRKLAYKRKITYDKNTKMTKYPDSVIFDYPYQKGDCIFHPNDPVRIAFRDPFDPRVWYWKFSGFVDGWSENVGTNKESAITLNCTDVTKMARYTYAQINTGILDQIVLSDGSIDTDKGNNVLQFFEELFAFFEIYEVLEILFFGVDSLEKSLSDKVGDFIANISEEEAAQYLLENFNAVKDDIDFQNVMLDNQEYNGLFLDASITEFVYDIKNTEILSSINKLKGKGLGVISHPNGTQFRRKDDQRGVNIYFYGEPDSFESRIGVSIKDLKTWNEVIHHRVRRSDLDDMSETGSGSEDFPGSSTWDMESIITIIGTNEKGIYPVGNGRVFYFTPAGLRDILGTDAIDKSLGGISSKHSVFIDNLSFLYDLAEDIEYCFYATPKGDVVFEMPFYDFDVEDFTDTEDLTDNSYDVSNLLLEYDFIFRDAYSGIYSEEELLNMTNLTFKITAEGTGFKVNDYSSAPIFDYAKNFTIESYEQYSFTNSLSDSGVCTMARSSPVLIKAQQSLDTLERKQVYVYTPNLIPILGLRPLNGSMLNFIDDEDTAKAYLGLQLNRMNSEARNLSVSTVPKFGLMVNRPVKWMSRTYSANVVNLSDAIVWNSDCTTSISMNQVRGWTGEVDSQTGRPIFKHFGGDRPFNLAKLLKGAD